MRKTPTILVLSLALVVAGCGDSDDSDGTTSSTSTFEADDFPFTFEYPSDWEETSDVNFDTQLGSSGAYKTVALLIDEDNGIFIEDFSINTPVTESTSIRRGRSSRGS